MKSRILSSARLSIPLATSIAALLAVSSAQAGTVWDGGGGNTNINTAANWDSDVVNALNGTTAAVFGTGGSTATINVNASFTGITINRNANFTIANGAGSLTLGTGGITVTLPNTTARSHTISESSLILNGNQTWTVTNNTGAATLSVSSVISETGGARNLTKAGSGTLTLSGLNTYTGVTTITAGTLSINRFTDGGVAGSLGMASNDSANLVMTGGTLSYSGASTTTDRGITFGALSGNPIITVSATGANLNLTNVIAGTASQQIDFTKGGVGTLTLSNDNNSYIGRTFVSGGTLAVTSISAVGAGTSSIGVATTAANGLISIGTGANTTTLSYIGTGNTTDRDLNLPGTAGGGVIEQSGTGLLKFTGAVGATGVGSKTLTLRGSTTGTGEIAGAIVDNGTTGTTVATAASNNSTSLVLGSVVGLTVGNEITGAGIPSSTTITAINPATRTVTLSAAATVASNAVITSSGLVNLTSLTKDGTAAQRLPARCHPRPLRSLAEPSATPAPAIPLKASPPPTSTLPRHRPCR
ncbi:MAG: autotransporter-associated beta strand repeat-containing protein [Akkermansiaceae bacterium]|nr:autotransporter-associated beta strand repeat-containing protein [Akkermansiaceae bacterium]